MNIKNTLLWLGASSATMLAVGARAYKYFYTQESAIESQASNRLLTQTLQDAYRVANEPSSAAMVSAISNTGLLLFSAYMGSNQRQAPAHMVAVPFNAVPDVDNSFETRLGNSGYDLNNVPDEFCCPISFRIMEKPVTAYTTCQNNRGETIRTAHVYDKSTYDQLRGTCPENRLPFVSREDNVELKNRIEAFVRQTEQNRARSRSFQA